MAGNVKFESSSGSPEDSGFTGSLPNTQRGSQTSASLDRLGNYRETSDARSFGYGNTMFKGNMSGLPPLPPSLNLDQVPLTDPKPRTGELRRALGISSHGPYSKLTPAASAEEVVRYKQNLAEERIKARTRSKRCSESLNKLKYVEVLPLRKQQANERSCGTTVLKGGTQSQRKSPDIMTQKLDDRGKIVPSRRARTPVADMRSEGRGSGVSRQHTVWAKDKDMPKEGSLSSTPIEEKIRRLPAGGETWERKMKRKRSVSNVFPRSVDGEGDMKRTMHGRASSNESGLPISDGHALRSGLANGVSSITKPDGGSSLLISSDRLVPRSETEKVPLSRELAGMNKDRAVQKGNSKINFREESHPGTSSLMTKGKASRASRIGPPVTGGSSPNFSRMSGTAEDREKSANISKIQPLGGINNRKRAMSNESSSPPMAQWVGQRPLKISRPRRTNIIPPTSNIEEALVSSEVCTTSDSGMRLSSSGHGSIPARSGANNIPPLKIKWENSLSPAQLAESEESIGVENKLQEKTVGVEVERAANGYYHAGSPGYLTNKRKLVVKEKSSDSLSKQGRNGRGSSFTRESMSPLGDKLDAPAAGKPIRSSRPGSEKNGSKSGRPPLKKHLERKGFKRSALVPNGNSPDCTGESDDDHEDLLKAAKLACTSNHKACSSEFWKKMEPLFSFRSDDRLFLRQQIASSEEHHGNLSHLSFPDSTDPRQDSLRDRIQQPHGLGVESDKRGNTVGEDQNNDFLYRSDFEQQAIHMTPLCQRILSALIIDDELELEEGTGVQHTTDWCGKDNDRRMDGEQHLNGSSYCNGYLSNHNLSQDDELEGDHSFMPSEPGISRVPFQNHTNGPQVSCLGTSNGFSSEGEYAQLSLDAKLLIELQNIGLCTEMVPDLAEGEDEVIGKELLELKKQLGLAAEKKKTCLNRLEKALEGQLEVEEKALEQGAVDRMTELAYKKLLSTRGSIAARLGVSRVPRHVALSFVRRTVARCQKYEETGRSCFVEPPLWDVLSGSSSCNGAQTATPNDTMDHNVPLEGMRSGLQSGGAAEHDGLLSDTVGRGIPDPNSPFSQQTDQSFAKNGPFMNRGKKKEVLLDDVSNGTTMTALRSSSPLGNHPLGIGPKGKRSERDNKDRDQSCRNSSAVGRGPRGERKAKSKPKQKSAQLSTTNPVFMTATGSSSDALHSNCGSNRKIEGLTSPSNIIVDSSSKDCNKDLAAELTNLPLSELDPLGVVGNEFDASQDLSSWFNFEEDNLLDHDSMGLDIPMDDLSELNMML